MIAALLLSLTILAGAPTAPTPATAEPVSEAELQIALRDLWAGHVFWTRSYALSTHYRDEAAAGAAETKVVENARTIANAIIPFYGQEAADRLFDLLAGHYGAVKEYLQASYAGRKPAGEAAVKKLSANADEIATFLAGANPYLPKEAVLPLLLAHGGHHVQQVDAIQQGDFKAEAEVWDAMLGHIHGIADALAGALARQFPDKVVG